MNGLAAGHNNCEPLESINALRDTLRHLKQTTDKAVVRFLVRSREALREEIKSQSKLSLHSCATCTQSFMFITPSVPSLWVYHYRIHLNAATLFSRM